MKKFKLPHFEEIDIDQLEEYYQVDMQHKGIELSLDINVKGKQLPKEVLENMANLIKNISNQDEKNRNYIESDYRAADGDTVKEFMEFHVEEIAEDLKGIVDFKNQEIHPEVQLLNKLKFVRMGFYPDGQYDSHCFAVCDYTVDREISDQLIVVNLNEKGELINLAWES